MKIAIFTDTYLPDRNGISASIVGFTKLLAEDGHQIMIFCPKAGFYRDKPPKGLKIRRFPSIKAPSYSDIHISLPSVWRATKELKAFSPDLVHIQTPIGMGMIGLWASKILKLKIIQTYHTYIPDFLQYFNPKSFFSLTKFVDLVNNKKIAKQLTQTDNKAVQLLIGQLKQRLAKQAEEAKTKKAGRATYYFAKNYTKAIYNQSDLVITPSGAMKKELIRQGVRVPIKALSNGVNFDLFSKKTNYNVSYKFVHIGRLGFEKNVDVIVRAFALAHRTEPKLRLDIFGDGPARPTLQLLAKQIGVAKFIKFMGAYDINQVAKYLCNYDFFVTASTIETQGIVLLEAMSAGLPVIGVNSLAVPEVVKDSINGYISKPFSVRGMANNILKMVERDDRLERLGKASLEIASKHKLTGCRDQLVEIYQTVIDK